MIRQRLSRSLPLIALNAVTGITAAFLVTSLCGCKQNVADQRAAAPSKSESEDSLDRLPTLTSSSSPGHAKMVRALREIHRQTSKTNVYIGDSEARELRATLASLPRTAPAAQFGHTITQLADKELQLGNETETIRLLEKCDKLFFPSGGDELPNAGMRDVSNQLKFSLGVAYLRFGETQNCCRRNTPDSCIMPIQGEGIHTNPEGSRKAIERFEYVLAHSAPDSSIHLHARWLLNIAYMTLGEYPDEVPADYLIRLDQFLSAEPFPKFVNVAQQKGIATFNLCGGAIADDFDRDGDLDLFLSTWDTSEPMRFFQNDGDGAFTDRTNEAGLEGIFGGLNMVQADFDNDGWTDILVLRGAWLGNAGKHPNSLLRNNGVEGVAQFTDVTFESGLANVNYPTQTAAWADYDNDGDLDLYIGNEANHELSVAPSQLFRNNGDRTFTDVAVDAGVTNDRFTKAVVWGDYDGDRLPDIYVSNYHGANRLYRNLGNGTFKDVAGKLKVKSPLQSFPAWFWDYDNDGVLDIFASAYINDVSQLCREALGMPHDAERSCLYRGDGQGGFEDVTLDVGLKKPTAPMGSNFGDLNGDGYPDFYLGTGDPDPMSLQPNMMYLNRSGERFADVTMNGGFGHLQKGHSVLFADLDGDGDQDVFEQMGGAFPGDKYYDAIFENPGFGNHWISLKLVGQTTNRSAIGARIRVDITESVSGNPQTRSIYRWVNSGGSFGANPFQQNIGLGKAEKIQRLEVFWPTTGKAQQWTEVPMDIALQVTEGDNRLSELD